MSLFSLLLLPFLLCFFCALSLSRLLPPSPSTYLYIYLFHISLSLSFSLSFSFSVFLSFSFSLCLSLSLFLFLFLCRFIFLFLSLSLSLSLSPSLFPFFLSHWRRRPNNGKAQQCTLALAWARPCQPALARSDIERARGNDKDVVAIATLTVITINNMRPTNARPLTGVQVGIGIPEVRSS